MDDPDFDFDPLSTRMYWERVAHTLMPALKKGVFHRTSIEGYRGILQARQILPNKGQFPLEYPNLKESFGYSSGHICLFDFESASERDYSRNYLAWGPLLEDQEPVTVILRLNRETLKGGLIPNSVAPEFGDPRFRDFIPFVEAWYPEPIPCTSIEGYIVTELATDPTGLLKFREFSKTESEDFERYLERAEEQMKAWVEDQSKS